MVKMLKEKLNQKQNNNCINKSSNTIDFNQDINQNKPNQ